MSPLVVIIFIVWQSKFLWHGIARLPAGQQVNPLTMVTEKNVSRGGPFQPRAPPPTVVGKVEAALEIQHILNGRPESGAKSEMAGKVYCKKNETTHNHKYGLG